MSIVLVTKKPDGLLAAPLGGAGGGDPNMELRKEYFVYSGNPSFTLEHIPVRVVLVSVNGKTDSKATDYAVSGNILTVNVPLSSMDEIAVVYSIAEGGGLRWTVLED